MNFNNFNYLAREAYKSIPLISPALLTDPKGNNLPETDCWATGRRFVVLFGLSLGASTYVPTLARLAFPYIVSSNSSVTFIAVVSYATPATILISIFALGVLCYELDFYLTDRATEEAAITQFMHNEKPSDSVFSMLIHNNELIKLLLKNKDVDLSKQNSMGQTLFAQYVGKWDYDRNVVFLLWDHTSDAEKVNFLISNLNDNKHFHGTVLNFLFDNNKISIQVFSQIECLLTFKPYQWSGRDMEFFSSIWDHSSDSQKIKALNSFLESSWNLNSNKIILEHLINNKKNFPAFNVNLENILPAFNCFCWSDSELKIFTLIWDHSLDKDKAKTFIHFKKKFQSHDKILNYLIDNKKISPKIFTESEQCELQNNEGFNLWSDQYLRWLKILGDLGFNIDAKGKDSQSVKECMLDDIYHFTCGKKNQKLETIISLINFLQSIEKHPTRFSIIRKIPTQHLETLQENLEKNFPKEKIDKNLLKFFVTSRYFLMQMSDEDNVKVGCFIWDKAYEADKKAVFTNSIQKFRNSKLAISLMKDKKVSASMFTEKEQYEILFDNLINHHNHLNVSHCFGHLAASNFNIDARNFWGKNIKDIILEEIESPKRSALEIVYFKEALEEVEKAWKKQVIKSGIALKSGQNDQGSNLFMIPGDILNNIVKVMAETL